MKMNFKILSSVLVMSLLAPHVSLAGEKIVLDCGRHLNVVRSIIISDAAPGSWMPYVAEATMAVSDPTTGVLTGVTFNMIGSDESGDNGKYIALIDEKRPQYQINVESPASSKKTLKASFDIVDISNKRVNTTELSCKRK